MTPSTIEKVSVAIFDPETETTRHTSISLEPEFRIELEAIAKARGIGFSKLVSEIEAARTRQNLSSACRLYALAHSGIRSVSVVHVGEPR